MEIVLLSNVVHGKPILVMANHILTRKSFSFDAVCGRYEVAKCPVKFCGHVPIKLVGYEEQSQNATSSRGLSTNLPTDTR